MDDQLKAAALMTTGAVPVDETQLAAAAFLAPYSGRTLEAYRHGPSLHLHCTLLRRGPGVALATPNGVPYARRNRPGAGGTKRRVGDPRPTGTSATRVAAPVRGFWGARSGTTGSACRCGRHSTKEGTWERDRHSTDLDREKEPQ